MFNFFKSKCKHTKLPANIEAGYCPDCGEYVENHWYLVRCKHCRIKRKAHLVGDHIVPETHFCPNCGGLLFEVERLEKINFIDIDFAVLKKEIVKVKQKFATATTWVEEQTNTAVQKLIGVTSAT